MRVGLPEYGADELLVTANAIVIENLRVGRSDLDGFVEVLERESLGVTIAVIRLANPLGEPALGNVAVVAGRVIVMTGCLPAVVLIAHDVAIHARLRVIAHVGQAVSKMKGVSAESRQHVDGDANVKNRRTKDPPPIHGPAPTERIETKRTECDLRMPCRG